jgi:hypothetical protein
MGTEFDRNDPEFVREIARKHWKAIKLAAQTGGDLAAASRPQYDYLTGYIPSLPPEVAKVVSDAYAQESVVHAEQVKRITQRQVEQARNKVAFHERARQHTIVFAVIAVLAVIAKIVAMKYGS